jgi:diaminopimelate epimerase
VSDNLDMTLRFSKMHGAGNDFVVIDGVRRSFNLDAQQWRALARSLADRHFGIGADQILLVEPATDPSVDFNYRIFNADGGEVEHCGNGARCFVRFVNEQGLSQKTTLKVRTMNGDLTLQLLSGGMVRVNMGKPIFEPREIPFDVAGLTITHVGAMATCWLPLAQNNRIEIAAVSMGNPHAVALVDNIDTADVAGIGPQVQSHRQFPNRVNAGFMQIINRSTVKVRVFERGVGETIACGTGVCAAVVSGIARGLLETKVAVTTRGGIITVGWDGKGDVLMTGPTQTVFSGEIDLNNLRTS